MKTINKKYGRRADDAGDSVTGFPQPHGFLHKSSMG